VRGIDVNVNASIGSYLLMPGAKVLIINHEWKKKETIKRGVSPLRRSFIVLRLYFTWPSSSFDDKIV
jgi:hypothetical protein